MDGPEESEELAGVLAGLKERSGLSYQELGRRVFTSSSTLHRYCNGKGTPADFDLVVRIAKECGADAEELNTLLGCWKTATGQGQAKGPVQAPTQATAEVPAEVPTRRRRPLWGLRLLLAAVMALVILGTAVASAPYEPATLPVAAPVGSTSWEQTPRPVDPELFGVTMNSFSGAMPSFRTGALRLWDSETRWAQLEPAKGEYDWSTLDRVLNGAEREGLPTMFVFGATPSWAAPDARKAAYPESSRAAPPDHLDDWDDFVRALVRHAGARIDAYELWAVANHKHHYNGSVRTLVEMTRRASRIIRKADGNATVVCPSITDLWGAEAHEFLLRFAELGGYQHCDAAGIKLYQRRVTDPPETMLEAVRKVDQTFHRAGYHLPLWSTGTVQTLPLNDPLGEETAADHAVRFYLTGLYARNRGLERMYFYAWGNGKIPLVLQAEGQPPTKAGEFVARLQRWLTSADLRSCGRGLQIDLPRNVWQCEFLIPDDRGTRRPAHIRWTHTGTAESHLGSGARTVEYLDGTTREVDGRETVTVTGRPILIRYG
ncbi:helix-turn-helix domain-containing protein [Streptomyces sp. NBC_01725]|uniref:helix-turn-helix domain-containing protein n=1 Tax=Streptomyces sp. NBC_01725 TaxID=2975923 RepID=UPI002E2D6C47|nr:helix-turn-helix domain-containing protein [Streptomyces sp. NBC_01725]